MFELYSYATLSFGDQRLLNYQGYSTGENIFDWIRLWTYCNMSEYVQKFEILVQIGKPYFEPTWQCNINKHSERRTTSTHEGGQFQCNFINKGQI